ncbi:DUF4139 domain-containing protein [Nitratifractor sp.]
MKKIFFHSLLFAVLTWAQTVVPPQPSELSLTVYNDNRAFVHETRKVQVEKGKQTLVYEGVASSVISASVIPTFSGVDTRLYSQNYSYDLVSLDSLLRHSIGKEVEFWTNGKRPTRSAGTLLASQPTVIVREKGSERILALEKPEQVIFDRLPEGMIPRPSLLWEVETARAGELRIDLRYLTTGIGWKSDYVLDLHEHTLDLVGWITVDNHSGADYRDVRLAFVAGELHRAEKARPLRMYKAMAAAPENAVRQEAFSGYHLYTIPFRQTLADKEQKQIRFLRRSEIGYHSYGQAVVSSFPRAGVQKLRFVNTVRFSNSKANHLGLPLPAGTVRIYREDSAKESRFVGESRIGNLPADENVTLKLGMLFDATGEKKIVKYVSRQGYRHVRTHYTLHNRGKTPLELRIEERIPTHGNRIELHSDCAGICSVRKLSAFVREFTVRLPAGKSYSFDSEFEVWR